VGYVNKRWRKRSLELFCPAEFHHISGVDVCLAFCRKKKCFVFNGHERVAKGLRSGMKSRAVRPKLKWENPHLVAHNRELPICPFDGKPCLTPERGCQAVVFGFMVSDSKEELIGSCPRFKEGSS